MAINNEELQARLDQHDSSTVRGAAERLKIMREAAQAPEENSEETEVEETEEFEEQELDERLFDSEDPEDEVEAEEDESPPNLEPPEGFTPQERETFAQLDEEAQKAVIRMERERQNGIQLQVEKVRTEAQRLQQQAEEVARMREEYVERLKGAADTSSLLPDPELLDEESEKYDPTEFYRQQAKYDRAKVEAERNAAFLREEQEKLAQEQREHIQKDVQVHTEVLLQRFPEWSSDHTKGKKELAEVKSYLSSGLYPTFTEDQINPIYNSDLLTVAWKAKKYDEMTGKRTRKRAPKTVKSSKQGRPQASQKAVLEAEERHKRERTPHSAAALLKAKRELRLRNR